MRLEHVPSPRLVRDRSAPPRDRTRARARFETTMGRSGAIRLATASDVSPRALEAPLRLPDRAGLAVALVHALAEREPLGAVL